MSRNKEIKISPVHSDLVSLVSPSHHSRNAHGQRLSQPRLWSRVWARAPTEKPWGARECRGQTPEEQGPLPATAQAPLCRLSRRGRMHNQPWAPAVPAATVQFLMVWASKIRTNPSQAPTTTYLGVTGTRQKFGFLGITFLRWMIYQDSTARTSLLPAACFQKYRIQSKFSLHRTMQLYSLFLYFFRGRQERDLDVHQEQPWGQEVDH